MEGVARPDGVPLVGVLAPSPKGLRLEAWSTCGEKVTGVGATRAVMVGVGTYVGTEATAGLVGVNGGVTRGGGGDMGGVWVIGDTTFTGLWGLGRTKGGGALTVVGDGTEELVFRASPVVAPADGNGGFVVGLEGGEDGGVGGISILDGDAGEAAEDAASFGDVEVETVILGVFWTGLSGGTGSGGAGTVFTMGTAGEAPPTEKYNYIFINNFIHTAHSSLHCFMYADYVFVVSFCVFILGSLLDLNLLK